MERDSELSGPPSTHKQPVDLTTVWPRTDQPTTCHECGTRTFNVGPDVEQCNNPYCALTFAETKRGLKWLQQHGAPQHPRFLMAQALAPKSGVAMYNRAIMGLTPNEKAFAAKHKKDMVAEGGRMIVRGVVDPSKLANYISLHALANG